ncbi:MULTISPECIES: sulfotransferase family 2 domain-containing protein [unclassified Ruegeria]|uniref:sulfotransferase family 2 domain-containing protein n=1 Tax=unclassified Ruegeria TaxID=2625375 RepID=UPI00148952A2|nr:MULTISPECIES: sulfotransferase family 2 domain-containing protein [unclassified Ruegeria]
MLSKVRYSSAPKIYRYRFLSALFPAYKNKAHLGKLDTEIQELARRSVFSNNGAYVYVKNPKCGTSAVAAKIYEWQYGRKYIGDIHQCPELVRGKDCPHELLSGLLDDKVFKFSFVRDPKNRVESAFKNFFLDFKNPEHSRHLPYIKGFGFNSDRTSSQKFDIFLDYIEYGISENPRRFDPHFRPQFFNLRPDIIKYSRIGKVEALNKELINLSEQFSEHEVENGTVTAKRINQSTSEFSSTPEQADRIRRLFDIDYSWFNY